MDMRSKLQLTNEEGEVIAETGLTDKERFIISRALESELETFTVPEKGLLKELIKVIQ